MNPKKSPDFLWELMGFFSVHLETLYEGDRLPYLRCSVKGTVSRDFSCPVFFIKQLLLVPIGKPRNDFEFFRIFVELFVFVIDSPAINTPGSRLEPRR